ncbi:DUF4402 domain-containing protein [Glaciecola sp. 33A]|uniref:DUF4402 domain-containing protein n=1 Tax=Glaciecola sp. 33A TaxID=2057807 RepID=UPI000C344D89|nr:DUF4402 domain-containing protein [Glaciecola sp. 33A]PKH99807.1 hypothetical protein CXF81_16560 [Glaciecola sp. 33A]
MQKITKNYLIIMPIALFSLLSISNHSWADIVPVQLLNFGSIAIANNSTPQTVTVDEFDNVNSSSGIRIIVSGQPAIYQLTDLVPNTTFTVDVDVVNVSMNPGEPSLEFFDLEILRVRNTVLSDNLGQATLSFGGRITTSGSNGLEFANATFRSNIRITVNN